MITAHLVKKASTAPSEQALQKKFDRIAHLLANGIPVAERKHAPEIKIVLDPISRQMQCLIRKHRALAEGETPWSSYLLSAEGGESFSLCAWQKGEGKILLGEARLKGRQLIVKRKGAAPTNVGIDDIETFRNHFSKALAAGKQDAPPRAQTQEQDQDDLTEADLARLRTSSDIHLSRLCPA